MSLPRLLAGIPAHGALDLSGHVSLHGELPPVAFRARGHSTASALVDEVERAGLRGRGGAGFPTAAKLRAVASARTSLAGRPPIVVVNGAEGEPASAKDRALLLGLPHLVLDGAVLAASAVGARQILLGVCESTPSVRDAAAHAIAERGAAARGAPSIELLPVPNGYVAGHESALVNHLSGGPPHPTFTPPRPFERGVRGRPTLVCNVETLAHLALIARRGAQWFRELGTPEQPGSALVTLCGPVAHPGVYEIEHGSPLTALIDAADGLTARPRALLLGGYSGTWVDASSLPGLVLADTALAAHRATFGAGVVVLLSRDACPVAELARLTRWLATQSTRQCGPCVFGLDAIATTFEQLVPVGSAERRRAPNAAIVGAASARHRRDAGGRNGQASVHRRLHTLAGLVDGRGACSHPDGVARMVASALDVFAEELSDHVRHGPCAACTRPSELPRPRAPAAERGARSEQAARARRERVKTRR